MMDESSNAKAILELSKCTGNDVCADCGYPNVEWASYNIGIYLCGRCADVHRGLGPAVSQVKHINMDRWEDSQVQRMHEVGNGAAKDRFEATLPSAYRVPSHTAPQALLEEWIVSKYVREDFCPRRKQTPRCQSGNLEEFLMKRGKEDPKYYPRKFLLNEEEGVIKYYVHENRDPKGILPLAQVSVSFAPEKLEKTGSMQVSYTKDNSTRHLYLYHEDPAVMVLWYQTIRCSILRTLQSLHPHVNLQDLVGGLPTDFKEGWLWKTGPKYTDAFRKRWFTLDRTKLMYHDEPLSAWPKGEIMLEREGFCVKLGLPSGAKERGYSFSLNTPHRCYYLSAETSTIRDDWMSALQSAIHSSTAQCSSFTLNKQSTR